MKSKTWHDISGAHVHEGIVQNFLDRTQTILTWMTNLCNAWFDKATYVNFGIHIALHDVFIKSIIYVLSVRSICTSLYYVLSSPNLKWDSLFVQECAHTYAHKLVKFITKVTSCGFKTVPLL